jgi:hypothetical protein
LDTVMNVQVPYNVRKFLSSCTTGGFSRRPELHGVIYMKRNYLFYMPATCAIFFFNHGNHVFTREKGSNFSVILRQDFL